MNPAVDLSLANDRVDVGDDVRVTVVVPDDVATADWRLVLQCRVRSAAPASVEVTAAAIPVPSSPCRLRVPDTGPLTRTGVSFDVSWSVLVVDHTGSTLAEKPVVMTPRGGVALWMQRHTPPPVAPKS